MERFNRTCLMMLSMFVNDWRDNWHELLPFVMHAYRTSVHESTGHSPFRHMMGEELGSPWVGPQQVVRQATGHTVGIQKGPDTPIIFIHVDDLKLCPAPRETQWTPRLSTAKSLCASTVAFRPGSHVSESDSSPPVMVSTWKDL